MERRFLTANTMPTTRDINARRQAKPTTSQITRERLVEEAGMTTDDVCGWIWASVRNIRNPHTQ